MAMVHGHRWGRTACAAGAATLVVLGVAGCASAPKFNPDDPQNVRFMGNVMYAAATSRRPIPVVSVRFPEWTDREAYAVQHHVVTARMRDQRVGGLKVGLSTAREMEIYGAASPVVGVLWSDLRSRPGARIQIPREGFMFVEPEIGFVVKAPILGPLPESADLADYLEGVVPVVELPWVDFEANRTLRRIDLIAANLGAHQMVVGATTPLGQVDLATVPVGLFTDSRRRMSATGGAAHGGDPLSAVRWLINEGTRRGWRLKPGDILITGNLSPTTIPASPGIWKADFGPLGQMEFFLRR